MSRIDQMFSERGPTASFEFFRPKMGKLGTRLFAGIKRVRAVAAVFCLGDLWRVEAREPAPTIWWCVCKPRLPCCPCLT